MIVLPEASLSPEVQMYVDVLDRMDPADPHFKKYVATLRDRYSFEYRPKDDKALIAAADPDALVSVDAFTSYSAYRSYALRVLELRRFHSRLPEAAWRHVTLDQLTAEARRSGLPISFELNRRGDVPDYAVGATAYVAEHESVCTVVHELGHVWQEAARYQDGVLLDVAYSPSVYGTTNGGECLAESFMHFFLDPAYPSAFPSPAKELHRLVSSRWTGLVRRLEALAVPAKELR